MRDSEYGSNESKKLIIACEELDFIWDEPVVKKFESLYKLGNSIEEIANILERDADEVLILFIDRIRRGSIVRRNSGILEEKPSERLEKGVYFNSQRNKFHAQLHINGKHIHLGYRDSYDEAAELVNIFMEKEKEQSHAM